MNIQFKFDSLELIFKNSEKNEKKIQKKMIFSIYKY